MHARAWVCWFKTLAVDENNNGDDSVGIAAADSIAFLRNIRRRSAGGADAAAAAAAAASEARDMVDVTARSSWNISTDVVLVTCACDFSTHRYVLAESVVWTMIDVWRLYNKQQLRSFLVADPLIPTTERVCLQPLSPSLSLKLPTLILIQSRINFGTSDPSCDNSGVKWRKIKSDVSKVLGAILYVLRSTRVYAVSAARNIA